LILLKFISVLLSAKHLLSAVFFNFNPNQFKK
jgi:hypothetical protein